MYHEDQYWHYTKQLDTLTAQFSAMPDTQWAASLYWNWLYTLVPLLQTPGKGYPFFMTTPAWADKALTSASGSWAELRHATILYAKQSYTTPVGVGSGKNYIGFPQGYVEPDPEAFGRLAALAAYMKTGLSGIGLSELLPLGKLADLEKLCGGFRDIAVKELENRPVSIPEYCGIASAYQTLNSIADFGSYKVPPQTCTSVPDIPDTSTALIVDVHTDPNSGKVLEVGTGKPMCLYVVVPVEGKLQLCRGAMFSYYEFQHPMADRLTDDQWRKTLASSVPAMPQWTGGFSAAPDRERFVIATNEGSYTVPVEDLAVVVGITDSIPGSVRAGDSLIAILQSDTIPFILVENNGAPQQFAGTLISSGKYRVAIPPAMLADTTVLSITCRTNGAASSNCFPPPKVPISYRRVVYKIHAQAAVNRLSACGSRQHPRIISGRLSVPPGTGWRIVDPGGRLVATIGSDADYWAVPPRFASKLLLLVPVGSTTQKPASLLLSR
jgi:hypothetical protein